MKRTFGVCFLVFGFVMVFQIFTLDTFRGGAPSIIGGLISVILICFLPAYLLMRKKKEFHNGDKE